LEFGSDEHIAWLNDLGKTPSYIFNVTKKMLGERLFKSIRVIPLDIDKLACDLHRIPLGTDWRAHKPWVGVDWDERTVKMSPRKRKVRMRNRMSQPSRNRQWRA